MNYEVTITTRILVKNAKDENNAIELGMAEFIRDLADGNTVHAFPVAKQVASFNLMKQNE